MALHEDCAWYFKNHNDSVFDNHVIYKSVKNHWMSKSQTRSIWVILRQRLQMALNQDFTGDKMDYKLKSWEEANHGTVVQATIISILSSLRWGVLTLAGSLV